MEFETRVVQPVTYSLYQSHHLGCFLFYVESADDAESRKLDS